jgi:hypothetical protein
MALAHKTINRYFMMYIWGVKNDKEEKIKENRKNIACKRLKTRVHVPY